MKKVLFYSLIFLFVVSALVLPVSYNDAFAGTVSITCYAIGDGTVLDSAVFNNYNFAGDYVSYQDVYDFVQSEFDSSYLESNSGNTYNANWSHLYRSGDFSSYYNPTQNIPTGSSVYVQYIAGKDIIIYQVPYDSNNGTIGSSFGSYTKNVASSAMMSTISIRDLSPAYQSIGLFTDLNWTSLELSTYQIAFDQGYVYAYYNPNVQVNYYYNLDNQNYFIISSYFYQGQPITPDYNTINSAIPAGYKVDSWYSSSTLSPESLITQFPYASGSEMSFYAKLVQDIPKVTISVILSLNNQLAQSYGSYTFDVGQTIEIPVPELVNYTFASWHSTTPCTGSNVIINLGQANENKVIYALMLPDKVTVNVYWTDSLMGTPYLLPANSFQIPYNSTPIMTPYLIREGYSMVKVTSDIEGNHNVNGVYGPLTKDTNFYVFFSESVLVFYRTASVNGSTFGELVDSFAVGVGSRAPYVSIPVKEGYTFVGYSVDSPAGTIVTELPIITKPTTIYMMYSYALTEGSSMFLYTVSFALEDTYTLLSDYYSLEDIRQNYKTFDTLLYDGVTVSLRFYTDNAHRFTYFATDLYSSLNQSVVYGSNVVNPTLRTSVTVNYSNSERFVFKLLTFERIENIEDNLSLVFKVSNDDLGLKDFNFEAVVPLIDADISVNEIVFTQDLYYLIQSPPVNVDGDDAVISVVGGFVNTLGEFFLKITTYKLFGVFPIYLLIGIPLLLSLVFMFVKALL